MLRNQELEAILGSKVYGHGVRSEDCTSISLTFFKSGGKCERCTLPLAGLPCQLGCFLVRSADACYIEYNAMAVDRGREGRDGVCVTIYPSPEVCAELSHFGTQNSLKQINARYL